MIDKCFTFEADKQCEEHSHDLKIIEKWLTSGLSQEFSPPQHFGSLTMQLAERLFDSRPEAFKNTYLNNS